MLWKRAPSALRQSFLAMGTEVTVTLLVDSNALRIPAEAAIAEIRSMILAFGRDAWAWGPGHLGEFNRKLANGQIGEIPAELEDLFRRAWACCVETGGLFEPRIGSLVRLWGFDEVSRIRDEPPPKPDVVKLLAAMRAAPALGESRFYGPAPGIVWDFGGIGKGYIVDLALNRLSERGFWNASVDAGGNLAVRGTHGPRPWRIGIRDPRAGARGAVLAAVEVRDEAVITHGDDQRYFEYGRTRFAHILDPATGWPTRGLRSLTVVHRDAAAADALGAALFVAGRERWMSLAAKLGIDHVLAVDDEGRTSATPRLAERLEVRSGPPIRVTSQSL